jgi:hypothetical protein
VNARAYSLAILHRKDLASLRGAASISLHAQETWALFLIMADSDEAVISLSEELGLTLDIKHEEGRWWRIAVGEREGGALRCEVCGPRHWGQPPDIRAERAARMATAPVTLTAEQVLEAARARGVPTFDTATRERLILLASLGLDLGRADVRAALLELHQRGELRLVRLSDPSFVRTDLGARGLRYELVDESALREGDMIFDAVVLA